jgi:zinc protease
VVEIVGETFGDWSVHGRLESPDLPPVRPMQGLKRRSVNIAGKAQADLVIGAPGPTRPSPDFMAAALGNNILGQFGMMGRIGHAVREQAGLAYYAYSSLSAGIGPGPWYVAAGVAPPDVEEAIALIYQEIGDFTSQPVSQEELEDSQAHFIGSLPLSLESNAGIASALVRLERFHLGLDYYQRYADLVRSVNVKQVLLAAQSYLAVESLGVAVAGSLVGE